MECKKCSVNIPSEFEFILAQNVCPKCGTKLMPDAAMKTYVDLKKRLSEVEFVGLGWSVVCERIAMFVVSNYEIAPLNGAVVTKSATAAKASVPTTAENAAAEAAAIARFKAESASIAEDMYSSNDEDDLSAEEIRAQEAARAEDLVAAREMGMDYEGLEDGEEMVTGRADNDRLQRLKKLAATSQISKTGSVGMIKRSSSQ